MNQFKKILLYFNNNNNLWNTIFYCGKICFIVLWEYLFILFILLIIYFYFKVNVLYCDDGRVNICVSHWDYSLKITG